MGNVCDYFEETIYREYELDSIGIYLREDIIYFGKVQILKNISSKREVLWWKKPNPEIYEDEEEIVIKSKNNFNI